MSTTHNSLPASSDKHHDGHGEASLYHDSHGHAWSGNPNYTLTQLIPELRINLGSSLDIGSGEGLMSLGLPASGGKLLDWNHRTLLSSDLMNFPPMRRSSKGKLLKISTNVEAPSTS